MKLRLGTRGSDLARTQSGHVAKALAAAGIETELVIISTSGDRSAAPSFGAIGPQGVFVREIEQGLIDREIDIAVHSFKDLPTRSPDDLVVAAVPPRRDPADWLFRHHGASAADASSGAWVEDRRRPGMAGAEPQGRSSGGSSTQAPELASALSLAHEARVGTASARRRAWLRHFRPDLVIESLRGNVPTRLRKLADGDFDAILLAGAGVERLAESTDLLAGPLAALERARLDPAVFVPAPAQGALAVQCRSDETPIREALAEIDDAPTRAAVTLERAALALAEGGCDTAFGAYARPDTTGFRLSVMLERNGEVLRAELTGAGDGEHAARAMAALDGSRERAAP